MLDPVEAASGEEALALLRAAAEPYRVALLDAEMPDLSGWQVAEAAAAAGIRTRMTVLRPLASRRRSPSPAYAVIAKPVAAASLWQSLAPGPAAMAPASKGDAGSLRPLRVLVAEDNVVNQTVAKRMLEKRGYRVTLSADGAAAVAAFETEPFDIVLMDVQMPVMDGLEATRAIRARERGGATRVPIIAMTANAMIDDRKTCLQAGMDGYVSKPVSAEQLTAAIEAAVPP
jgi:CheY-like chemotaxis protein